MNDSSTKASRATTIEELENILSKFFDSTAIEQGLAFQPNPTDIIISPFAKCGTTWLQQTTHGLRTRGSMDFNEITAVTPWIEIAYDVGWDLDAPQVAQPRVFKSHLSWYNVPKGCRYIVSFRHYHSAMVSFYRFFEGYMVEPSTITLEALTRWRSQPDDMGEHGYWHHLRSWWKQRDNPNVLLLCYEDMMADLHGTVERIANFMEIELDDELRNIVLKQSSREFMLAHKDQFDENLTFAICGKRANLPPVTDSAKITAGTPNDPKYQLSDALKQHLDDIWHAQITTRFGLATYDDLRHTLRANNLPK